MALFRGIGRLVHAKPVEFLLLWELLELPLDQKGLDQKELESLLIWELPLEQKEEEYAELPLEGKEVEYVELPLELVEVMKQQDFQIQRWKYFKRFMVWRDNNDSTWSGFYRWM